MMERKPDDVPVLKEARAWTQGEKAGMNFSREITGF